MNYFLTVLIPIVCLLFSTFLKSLPLLKLDPFSYLIWFFNFFLELFCTVCYIFLKELIVNLCSNFDVINFFQIISDTKK